MGNEFNLTGNIRFPGFLKKFGCRVSSIVSDALDSVSEFGPLKDAMIWLLVNLRVNNQAKTYMYWKKIAAYKRHLVLGSENEMK